MVFSNKIAYSISLPTRPTLTLTVEEQLCQLRSSGLATSSSSSSISKNLVSLKILYESVDALLHLQSTQQEKKLDLLLDGSVMLLDVCSTTRDVLSQMRESVQDLQSSIRRRRGEDLDLAKELDEYMISRKKVIKVIRKCLGGLKKMQCRNYADVAVVSVLKEVETATLFVFQSLLSFLSGPKQSNWFLVSKFMLIKRVACGAELNEVERVEVALNAKKIVDAQKPLWALEMSIQDLEEGLESVFRALIKTRVSLLNILNH